MKTQHYSPPKRLTCHPPEDLREGGAPVRRHRIKVFTDAGTLIEGDLSELIQGFRLNRASVRYDGPVSPSPYPSFSLIFLC